MFSGRISLGNSSHRIDSMKAAKQLVDGYVQKTIKKSDFINEVHKLIKDDFRNIGKIQGSLADQKSITRREIVQLYTETGDTGENILHILAKNVSGNQNTADALAIEVNRMFYCLINPDTGIADEKLFSELMLIRNKDGKTFVDICLQNFTWSDVKQSWKQYHWNMANMASMLEEDLLKDNKKLTEREVKIVQGLIDANPTPGQPKKEGWDFAWEAIVDTVNDWHGGYNVK